MIKQVLQSVLIAAALAAAPGAHAQVAASATMATEIQRSGYISLSSSSINFPTPTAADFQRGYTQPATVGLRFGGNGVINLLYNFDTPTLTGSAGGSIPVSRIDQSVDGGSPEAMTQYGSGWRIGIAPGDYSETLSYVLNLDWASTSPQSYSANVTYTIMVN